MIPMAKKWQSVIAPTYAQPEIKLMTGKGTRVFDESGKSYLDFLAGIAVNSLGHCHPAISEAIGKQSKTLGHVSNLYANPIAEELAHRLLEVSGFEYGKVFFCNSGAEANEAAIKYVKAACPGKNLVSLEGGFHGRTIGALSITGQSEKRRPFEPLLKNVSFIEPNSSKQIKRINRRTGGVWLEMIQGEGGVLPLTESFVNEVVQKTKKVNALLVVDEVQTGIGRTGNWFAFQHSGIKPDLVPIAKGLGGGLPIGALLISKDLASTIKPGGHGTTYGGNPIAAASALAVLQTIESENLMANVIQMSQILRNELLNLSDIAEVRGSGLLIGVVFKSEIAKAVAGNAQELGLLINAVRPNVIRIAPPLNVLKEEVLEATQILTLATIEAVENG